jgi:FkbH-like protein
VNKWSANVFAHLIRERKGLEGRLALVSEALAQTSRRFDGAVLEAVAGELGSEATSVCQWLERQTPSAGGAYLHALLGGESSAWERFFSLHYSFDPWHRLAYARAAAAQRKFELATGQLRLALGQEVPYSFFPRAEKLARTLARNVSDWVRQTRIAVLGTSTTQLLVPVLETLCLRDRIHAEFYQGLYGSVEQEILDPESGLGRFQPGVVYLVNHWRDLALPAAAAEPEETVARVVSRQKTLWERLSARFACHVVQHGFDYPAEEPYGPLSSALPGGRSHIIEAINRRLQEEAPSWVSVLDIAGAQRLAGSTWEDSGAWSRFRQHPATEALPQLAELQAAHLRAALGLTRKVMIADLDNTLWHGIIGEDGPEGIQIGPGTPAGEAHQRLQAYLRDLRARGVLLAVCSKNNPEDARLPFEKNEHMLLRLEDFAAFEANWNDKATNLRRIAEKLSLGLDSFVFLDDSPVEREWVRSQLPQVAVIEPGPTVFHYLRDLDRGRHFFATSLSKEDLARADQYRAESQRELLKSSAESIEEFLAQLQLQASVAPITAANLGRVTQLANKTNQFNTTTRRYTEAQIGQLAEEEGNWAGAFHLNDRVGNYGLIGLILCRRDPASPQWEIETWLMSCRALGRQMERFMFDRLIEAAEDAGIREITALYRPTGRNQLVENLYEGLGFTRVPGSESDSENSSDTSRNGEKRYRIPVSGAPRATAVHVRDTSVGNCSVPSGAGVA